MVKLIILDLDGTIVNAYRAIEKSLNFTLRKLGYPPASISQVRRAVGWGDENFIKRFVKEEDIEKGLEIYRQHHQSALLKYSLVIPKVKRILTLLKKRNYQLAIASNRPEKFTKLLLNHLGLKKYFATVICAKNKDEIKPHPWLLLKIIKKLRVKKNEAIYLGDMTIDVQAGRNAGIRTIAILGGSSSRNELKKVKPSKIISKFPELLNFLS
ncbi:MAG TPA: hypothetical protein DHV62_08405 [Elusimicrobia bacterium]|jgi:phosphoglycolate phosphatase|nr:hypothetical protein [Elusimicrobiota bacterium]